ncbi:hypothetical protein [Bermanella sp. R86510]|uniref:hypothetical protein n=1 Tax=unclassified Bermanella TaxID=2627862 RepID=UPI0037CBBB21
MNVVHLSKTPLASSPGRMSLYLNKIGVNSVHFFEQDYPDTLKGKMTMRSFHLDSSLSSHEMLEYYISKADVVHVHNYISASLVVQVNRFFEGGKLVFHAHSPLREGPLFTDVSGQMDLSFTDFYVVAQYQPRHYQNYIPVCNIVPEAPCVDSSTINSPLRILYTPAHNREGGRWNPKGSIKLASAMDYLSAQNKVELKSPPKLSESQLLGYRSICDVTVDEIVTGSYHQISLEGLSAGNVVINNADFFSIEMLRMAARAKEAPPFLLASVDNIGDKLEYLVNMSEEELLLRKQESREYFDRYLQPDRLAEILVENYES